MTLRPLPAWLSELILRDRIRLSILLKQSPKFRSLSTLAMALASRALCVDDVFAASGGKEQQREVWYCVGAQAVHT